MDTTLSRTLNPTCTADLPLTSHHNSSYQPCLSTIGTSASPKAAMSTTASPTRRPIQTAQTRSPRTSYVPSVFYKITRRTNFRGGVMSKLPGRRPNHGRIRSRRRTELPRSHPSPQEVQRHRWSDRRATGHHRIDAHRTAEREHFTASVTTIPPVQ